MPQDKNTQLPADTEPTAPTEGTDTTGTLQTQTAAAETRQPTPAAA